MALRMMKRPPDPEQRAGSAETLLALNQVDDRALQRVSQLPLPEIAALKQQIAEVLPAGTLPGLVLAGLMVLRGRRISRQRAEEDLNTLFQGVRLVPRALYSVLYSGPAAVLWAYQLLARLAGKTLEDAFPEGAWQFYCQLGLREDSARHAVETRGYHTSRPHNAAPVDDIAAWLMAAIYTLFDSDGLNETIWTEWVTLRLLRDAFEEIEPASRPRFAALLRAWAAARPHHVTPGMSYAEMRRGAFDQTIKPFVQQLPPETVAALGAKLEQRARAERDAYRSQMSLLARLEPHRFRDERVAVPVWEAHVGLIWRGNIYLFPLCTQDAQERPVAFTLEGVSWPLIPGEAGRLFDPAGRPLALRGGWLYHTTPRGVDELVGYIAPPDPARIKGKVAAILHAPRAPATSTVDLRLASAPRGQQEQLRRLLPEATAAALEELSRTPILINWDEQPAGLPLGTLRRNAHRGIGDHPLTILHGAERMIFDLSPTFFDAAPGLEVAEMMTNQAAMWCQQLVRVAPPALPAPQPLNLAGSDGFESALARPDIQGEAAEVDVEATLTRLDMIERTRGWLRQRGIVLKIGDLLVLARLLLAAAYRPGNEAALAVTALPDDLREAVSDSLDATSSGVDPALLMLVDASLSNPRERVYPTTFHNVLAGLIPAYQSAVKTLAAYNQQHDDGHWLAFEQARAALLAHLGAFGELWDIVQAIARNGDSISTARVRLLAHLPASLQHLLDDLPEHFGTLNEVLRGDEVFANLGRAARATSVGRYLAARDDGRAKSLVWGILTDSGSVMHITLRDFRPHVEALLAAGHEDVAVLLAQDYLDSYVRTLMELVDQLGRIAAAEDVMRWQ